MLSSLAKNTHAVSGGSGSESGLVAKQIRDLFSLAKKPEAGDCWAAQVLQMSPGPLSLPIPLPLQSPGSHLPACCLMVLRWLLGSRHHIQIQIGEKEAEGGNISSICHKPLL